MNINRYKDSILIYFHYKDCRRVTFLDYIFVSVYETVFGSSKRENAGINQKQLRKQTQNTFLKDLKF